MVTQPVGSMRIGGIIGVIAWLSLVGVTQAARMDRYVRTNNPDAQAPFTDWAMAATDLKTAVDCANTNNSGDNVIVSNGTYLLTATINVTNVVVTSFSGDRAQVIINGNSPTYTNRCFYLNNANARLVGLTITNGCTATNSLYGDGGGIYLASGCVSNCVIIGNQAWSAYGNYRGGGGIYITGGGIVSDCLISGNTLYSSPTDRQDMSGGGGAYVYRGRLTRSSIVYNVATNRNGLGGGLYIYGDSASTPALVDQCAIVSNKAYGAAAELDRNTGSAVCMYGGSSGSIMSNCSILANTSFISTDYAGAMFMYQGGIVRNCVFAHNVNTAGKFGTIIYYGTVSTVPFKIENCTIVSNHVVNSTWYYSGGIYLRGTGNGCAVSNVVNCIIRYNDNIQVKYDAGNETGLVNSCVSWTGNETIRPNPGGTTNDPMLVSIVSNDFRLSSAQSSCYNHGTNLTWMYNSLDLGGHSRIDRFSGIVDIGAYEYFPAGTIVQVW